jgi:hypothetical protein
MEQVRQNSALSGVATLKRPSRTNLGATGMEIGIGPDYLAPPLLRTRYPVVKMEHVFACGD